MSRIVPFPRRYRGPADRALAELLVGKLIDAKCRASEDGLASSVEYEGQTIATLRVVDDAPNDSGFVRRTVFVFLTNYGRSLVPIPWGR